MKQGDIYMVNLDPAVGAEQAGPRPVVIVSQDDFNQRANLALVVPVTQGGNFARMEGFAVPLSGAGTRTQGVILCHQLRAIDLRRRGATRVERLPREIVQQVLDQIIPIFED